MAKKAQQPTTEPEPVAAASAWPEQTETRSLPCKLSPPELAERADELARGQLALERIEDEKKSAASEYKARIDGKTAELSRLSHVITARAEHRTIKCRWAYEQSGFDAEGKPIWHPEQKTLVRLDTDEAVEVRPITDEERQLKLNLEAKTAASEPEPEPETPDNVIDLETQENP